MHLTHRYQKSMILVLTMLVAGLGTITGFQAQPQGQAQAPPAPASAMRTDDLDQFTWRHIGPFSFSGRIANYAVPRGQSLTYYVLTASGGLWKTVDGGIHFEPIFDRYGNMSMGFMAVSPSNPNILYLGTGEPMHARSSAHGNGMWKSTDAGKTWTNIGLKQSYYISKVEVDFKNPDIVYIACEGKLYDNEMDCERGLYKTTDGGITWTRVLDLKDRGVGDFVIDPMNSDMVIAAGYKIYRRAWTYLDRQDGNAIYKTTDGGKTWKKLTAGLPFDAIKTGRTGLAIFEKNPKIVYARVDEEVDCGLNERENASLYREGGVFRDGFYFKKFKNFKINAELAKWVKFTPLTADSERDLTTKLNDLIKDKDFQKKIEVDATKFYQSARKVFAKDADVLESISDVENLLKEIQKESTTGRVQALNRHLLQTLYGGCLAILPPVKKSGILYRSDDQGETWKKMTEYKLTGGSDVVNQTEAGYYGRILVDQTNDQVIYCPETITTVSRDGGKTFKNAGWEGNMKTHVDHRAAWLDPANPLHILSANDGGVSESWDGGLHWSQKETISAQQFYDISVDNEQPYNIMGGTQDNGCWLGPSQTRNQYGVFPADWTYLPTGDGFYAVRDWWNPEYVYYESQFGSSSRMNIQTGEITSLAKRNTPEENAEGKPAQRYQWNAPIVLSPHNPGIVYVCSQYVHRSLSRGERGSFVTISPDLTKASKERIDLSKKTNLQYATIYTFAESAKKPGLYWAGTDDGNIQMSPDGGVTWINITNQFYDAAGKPKKGIKGALIPYDRWVKRVLPSQHDENTCYVAFNGYRTHNEDKTWLYVTRDLGKTWEDISGNMMNPVYDIEEDPANPNVLFLGTDYGVFVTMDQGKSWVNMSMSAPQVIIRDLAIQKRDRDLIIGTYGRGIYIADIGPFKEFKNEVFQKDAHLFDIEECIRWNRLERKGPSFGEMAKVNNPPLGANIYYYLKTTAKTATVTIKDLEGNFIQEISGKVGNGIQRVFWSLNRRVDQAKLQAMSREDRERATQLNNGTYKVTLSVDGKEVAVKDFILSPDPMFK